MQTNIKSTLRIVGIAFLVLVAVALIQTYVERRYNDNFNKAEELFRKGHYKHAFYYYDQVPKDDPRYTMARIKREQCARVLDSLKKAKKGTH
ncbi:MAG: hypothetical protein NZ455_08995 [Bacteroidia bacterium]|nr:hypothetical protein [Bacteroidia bacterium]MDW8346301.1 hypothetical protein [Bacteroidia bacterium]